MKIDIDTENDKRFKDIATLIDKPDFIKAIESFRLKWNLSKRYKTDEYKNFYSHIWGSNNDDDVRWKDFLKDIRQIRYVFKKTPNFDDVILYAMAFDKIPPHAYKTCYIEAENLDPSGENGDEYRFHIIFSPETTRDEILEEFAKFKNGLVGKTDLGGYEWDIFPSKKIIDKTSPNIRRDRDWYWMKEKEGMSYAEILMKAREQKTATYDRSGIIKAVKAYRKRLV